MTANELIRSQLEQEIIKKGWAVDISITEGGWLDSEPLEIFLQAWWNLVEYYMENADDTVIGVEVLREYLHYTRLLRNMMLNPDLSAEHHEKAQEVLHSLENSLEEIITDVVSYLDSNKE